MEAATSLALRLAHVHVPHLGRRQPNDVSDESAAARARRGSELSYPLDQLFVLVFRSPFVAIESSRARLPLAGTPNAPPRTLYRAPKLGRRAPRGLVSQFFLLRYE